MKRVGLVLLAVIVLGAGFGAGFWYARKAPGPSAKKGERKILYWVDPMHPAYKSDKPGIAPDCGMKLEPVYEDGGATPAAKAERKILYYHDPKSPSYKSDKPGLNPETGNDLEPVYEDANFVKVSTEKQQLIGVQFGVAEITSSTETIRAVGKIALDETKITRVHARIDGWIQKVHADFTGQLVKKGDPLLTIYSPEMVASQQEFLLALKARDAMKAGPSKEAYENSEILIEAARRRLELWDLDAAQIAEIEKSRKPQRTVTLYSPASGYVTSRNAFPSQRMSPETELYAIADMSRVWIMADVFETDLPKIRAGQSAVVSLPQEGKRLAAKVMNVQPQVDPATRTLKVRLEAANENLRLKPEMFVDVDLQSGGAPRLTVPASAVLNTGARKSVFVDRGNGNLEPKVVETGDRIGDRIQITNGLKAGDRVVTSGNFLIDSEAQLKAGTK